jgi:cytochrome c-type protein NrfB
MKAKLMIPLVVSLSFFVLFKITVGQNKGAADMMLQGGKPGDVPFAHHLHQSNLGNCDLCHNLFPQAKGSIDKLKAEGKLKKKEVMDQCRDCHKEKQGPIKCSECHKK